MTEIVLYVVLCGAAHRVSPGRRSGVTCAGASSSQPSRSQSPNRWPTMPGLPASSVHARMLVTCAGGQGVRGSGLLGAQG